MTRAYVIVEGQGEQAAAVSLLARLWEDLGLPAVSWAPPIRGKGLRQELGQSKYCEYVRRKPDVGFLLLLRDEDDDCPRDLAPREAEWMATRRLPFPAAVVMAHREYESLFLACVEAMAGKGLKVAGGAAELPGLSADATFGGDPETVRDVKGWLTRHMAAGRTYKPTVHQLPMTRMVEFEVVRRNGLPWFGTLERALQFLAANLGREGCVYPPPRES